MAKTKNTSRVNLMISPMHKEMLKEQSERNQLPMNVYIMYLLMLEDKKYKQEQEK